MLVAFPANPVHVSPFGMLLLEKIKDMAVGVVQKNNEIPGCFLTANRTSVTHKRLRFMREFSHK